MTSVVGMPLQAALDRLEKEGVFPDIVRTAGPREWEKGTERVIRVSRDGRRLTVARFRDVAGAEEEA